MGNNRKLFCSKPFKWFEVSRGQEEGEVFVCCPAWLPTPIGNLNHQSVTEIWNGEQAQRIRKSILDGSFQYCSRSLCPYLLTKSCHVQRIEDVSDEELKEIIEKELTILPYGPREISCSYDRSCNLSCPSCRRQVIIENERKDEILKIQQKINDEALVDAQLLYITGSGDPFGSPFFRRWLQTMKRSAMPHLKVIHLHTNALLWTPRIWETISKEVRDLVRYADISIDASTCQTYEMNRRGGKFHVLLKNLEFISKLRKEGPIEWLGINMAVQENNFLEMPDFVHLGKQFDVDTVYFQQLVNWGTFTAEQFQRRAIHLESHPRHQEFAEVLHDDIFDDPVVSLGNLTNMRHWLKKNRDRLEPRLNLSVIIPAHNAAETIAETLNSLLTQTYPNWEAIVVNDGSSDETAAIAASFAEKDPRICILNQPSMGVCTARNTGIGVARYDWLLFLDSDDWISPCYFERFNNRLCSDPRLDAIVCGSVRVGVDGKDFIEKYLTESGDLFNTLARFAAFPIHACVARRSLVESVGGFDTSFRTCEDWDLWQRFARTGAQFGIIHEVLAFYRTSQGSLSQDGFQMLIDGLRVIKKGFSFDRRVQNPHPTHVNGLLSAQFYDQSFYFLCWCASLAIGGGVDARPMLDALKEDKYPLLDPKGVAQNIFEAIPLSSGLTPGSWDKLWSNSERRIDEFLVALENQTKSLGLARLARIALERMVLEHSTSPKPLTVGTTHAIRVEVTKPFCDIRLSIRVENLYCDVELEGTRIGLLDLPVCDGIVPAEVLADAVAAQFAWSIIGRFFEKTVYPDLLFKKEETGLSVHRGTVCLAEDLSEEESSSWAKLHNRVGWTLFLQEIWGRPQWLVSRFYDNISEEKTEGLRKVLDKAATVEVGGELTDLEVSGEWLDVEFMAGGTTVAFLTLPVEGKRVHAQQLRATLTKEMGFELCRAAVREGIIGAPLNGSTLRELLIYAAERAEKIDERPMLLSSIPDGSPLAPSWARAVKRLFKHGRGGWVLGRHAGSASVPSLSRRALMPIAAAPDLIGTAQATGQPVIKVAGEGAQKIWYAPDLLWKSCQKLSIQEKPFGEIKGNLYQESGYNRHYFESLFLNSPNPWSYETPYEQLKYQQTLSLVPLVSIDRALELACAEGFFTKMLASRVKSLLATDISQVAIDRAEERCRAKQNVRFALFDFTKDPLPGKFDLIVCSEVLYYVNGLHALRKVARKIADALEPEGNLLTAHANVVVDDPTSPGFDWDVPFGAKAIGQILAETPLLRFIKELRSPLYRIQLFQRRKGIQIGFLPFRRTEPETVEDIPSLPPAPHVADRFLMKGGNVRKGGIPQSLTYRLPILMYHRVAPAGSVATARYRVAPDVFEQHLKYLRDGGFYSVSLYDWREAMQAYRPIQGHAVLLTFDDGCLDFLEYAWPLLKRYGFSAIVFLVADKIGQVNSWDHIYGEELPLLGWKNIHQLQDEGVEFGSHTATHPYLTVLSPADVVREAARSRSIIERGLKKPVTAFAYPYGSENQAVQHLIGACGYTFGLSCRPGSCGFTDHLLALPRIEICGEDTFQDFVAKMNQ
jgi:peptidoglycan/xylan/chitin deacetylase (PgdA/CDA1 family)/SAM-dependent methyltransferase